MRTSYILLLYLLQISYAEGNCPKEAIHCVYNTSLGVSKWARITMARRNIVMTLCLNDKIPIYLEKDDIETDQLPPGTQLTWLIEQCLHKDCEKFRSLAIDKFFLLFENEQYLADPPKFAFAFDPNYGDSCEP